MPKRVAIVGGGITGLTAAYTLERLSDCEIDLYEASDRLGGKLRTIARDGFVIEEGPDCIFTRKPGVMDIVCELGLEDQLVEPKQKEFFMLVDGKLEKVPGGLVTFTYSNPEALERATFLSEEGRRRALDEVNQPAGTEEDESIRSFFTRRFGPEFCRLVAEPLLAGTHGGDPDRLSMKMLYPGYLALERKRGSLAAAMEAAPPTNNGPSFLSFRGGMQTLVDTLAARLERARVHLNSKQDAPSADHVLWAIPSNQAPYAQTIEHRSSTIVTFVFDREHIGHSLDGTGFLVPPTTEFPITGTTWSSEKWPSRAPEDKVLIRAFIRGVPEGAEAQAFGAIETLLDIKCQPLFTCVSRWRDALPQYNVGHSEVIDALEAALPENTTVAGTSYRGVGVPDCIRQGREAAAKIQAKL